MTYNININQEKLLEHQLNITQWMVLSVIANAPTWTDTIIKDNEVYFWTARQLISKELPILELKNDTVYRVLKKLALLGFIDYEKQGKKDCTRLTKQGKNLFTSTMSDSNNEKGDSTMSDCSPTDNYTNNTVISPIMTENNKELKEQEQEHIQLWSDYSLGFLKRNGRSSSEIGSKKKSLNRYIKLRQKGQSYSEIREVVNKEAGKKFGNKHLENILSTTYFGEQANGI